MYYDSQANIGRAGMPTFLEFFAGIGLVRLGLEQAGWKCLWSNDIDHKKWAMYRGYFWNHGGQYVVEDIHNLNGNDLPAADLATCSFPCVDLSLAGYYRGLAFEGNERSSVFWQWIRILDEMGDRRPPLVQVENVLGMISARGGQDFRDAISALNQLGYTCDAFVVDAIHFTPQSRPRLFIIGALGYPLAGDAELIFGLRSRATELIPERLYRAITDNQRLRWMHLKLPPLPPATQELAGIIEDLPDNHPSWWPDEKVQRLYQERLSDRHRAIVDDLIGQDRVGYRTAFNRVRKGKTYTEVRNDEFAGCLRTPQGGSGRQIVIAAGQGALRARLMTPREAARLQGVPDEYPLVANFNDNMWGFGDAVAVPVVAWIGAHALNPLYRALAEAKQNAG